jgi:hypothetical protein
MGGEMKGGGVLGEDIMFTFFGGCAGACVVAYATMYTHPHRVSFLLLSASVSFHSQRFMGLTIY